MRVAVIGASGQFGKLVCSALEAADVDVVRASRETGVDAVTGHRLAEVCAGADVVADVTSTASRDADDTRAFFGAVARNVLDAAPGAIVYLTIVGAADPRVSAALGHYAGKAEQERVYGDRATAVASVQWFSLAAQFLLAGAVPDMRCRPAAVADVAAAFADVVLDENRPPRVEVAGPEEIGMVEVATRIAEDDGFPDRVTVAPTDPILTSGLLIPEHPDVVTTTTLGAWLAAR